MCYVTLSACHFLSQFATESRQILYCSLICFPISSQIPIPFIFTPFLATLVKRPRWVPRFAFGFSTSTRSTSKDREKQP
ncbi:hypothetical protein L873DRAFT_460698 [Choiromyces venosus 120613-1]|uniref:Uncharacterized protein n=1 Tax=Choiromyces venosus 120613-1 TaxID=1336337 RepID=A0A3N4JYS7_9PEZI|nr:hypothetical protein L873DRAFT_460698 [Choiromyces venosus 120613-1]